MKLYFSTEARFVKRNNRYYSLGGYTTELWNRYLEHFDELVIIARVTTDDSIIIDESMNASCNRVSFIELPYYIGFKGYILKRTSIISSLSKKLINDGCYICRLPGQIGGIVISVLNKKKIPYSCEVVGNPWDVFAKGSVEHPLRPIIRRISTVILKKQVKNSEACLYVTQRTLQQMYPTRKKTFSVGVSDVIVRDDLISSEPKVLGYKNQYSIISVGSLAQMYKAPDIVLTALYILKKRGFNLHLTWLGDGKFKQDMIDFSKKLGVDADFKGNVSPDIVHQNLTLSDIFLLVSRTEGLPRAMVEAMAHGLPCIGSRVGGIPELLESSALVEKDNPEQLAELIQKMITDYEFVNAQARRNLNEAFFYKESRLKILRNSFFEYIKSKRNE